MVGLGMTKKFTGLVRVGAALSGMPAARLPVLTYNLILQLFAGAVSRKHGKEERGEESGVPAESLSQSSDQRG